MKHYVIMHNVDASRIETEFRGSYNEALKHQSAQIPGYGGARMNVILPHLDSKQGGRIDEKSIPPIYHSLTEWFGDKFVRVVSSSAGGY